jgi:hypothetical protein
MTRKGNPATEGCGSGAIRSEMSLRLDVPTLAWSAPEFQHRVMGD